MKGKSHDLNHDLTFSAHTINYVCHSIRSMFRVLGVYNFVQSANLQFILSHHDDNEVFFPDMDTIIKSHIAFQKETATEN